MQAAVAAMARAIGADRISIAMSDREAAATATFACDASVAAIVRPASTAEVAACLRLASEHRAPLHPISKGLNWGFGSKAPFDGEAILLDLSALDRIRVLDADRAFAVVEPGVSFRRLHEAIALHAPDLFWPAIGGSPEASVLGNALERGHGIGPSSRRGEAVGALEILLADGSATTTGFGFEGMFAGAQAHGHGLGPSLTPLFLQSNLGIVTAMTIKLERKPALLAPFHAPIDDLGRLLDALPPAVQRGALGRHLLTIWNGAKLRAATGPYRWQEADGAAARPAPSGWRVAGAFYAASVAHLAAAEDGLKGLPGLRSPIVLDPADPVARDAAPAFLGQPSDRNLKTMYWRRRQPPPDGFAPERDRCGVVQLCPLLPMGAGAVDMLGAIEAIAERHGFDAQIGFDCADSRMIEAFVTIAYDRDAEGEDARAMACHDAMLARMGAEGIPVYRTGIQRRGGTSSPDLVSRLKAALDPHRVIDPARA